MIAYLDSSVLVKRYARERGSAAVERLILEAEMAGTVLVARAEVAAALGKAARTHALTEREASRALQLFRAQWAELAHVQVTDILVSKADSLAWEYGLRGFDSVHLAAALIWQEAIGEPVTVATFDQQLWEAGQKVGVATWPTSF